MRDFYVNTKQGCYCGPKYAVNPYSGCSHACFYCYAAPEAASKPGYPMKLLERELEIAAPKPVRFGTITDPYPPEELEFRITRKSLEAVNKRGFPMEVVTKSDLVSSDADVLYNAVVEISVNTPDKRIASLFEPGAPSPSRRIDAIKSLSEAGIPVIARLDPLIPFYTDSRKDLLGLLDSISEAGARQVISKVMQMRDQCFDSLDSVDPRIGELFREKAERRGSYYVLPLDYRQPLLSFVAEESKSRGMGFTVCREPDVSGVSSCACDAWLQKLKA